MPIVHISLMQGRAPEKVEAMIAAVSQAVAESIDAPIETVRVLVREMQPHQYGIGGKPFTQIQAERMSAAKPDAEASPT